MEWYGLIADGEIISIQRFHRDPCVMDFKCCFFSWIEYEVVVIDPKIIGHLN